MDVLQGVTIALLVIAALAGTITGLQRKGWVRVAGLTGGTRGQPRRMEAVERLTLTPQTSLHLVRVDGRLMLVSCGPGGCSIRAIGEQS